MAASLEHALSRGDIEEINQVINDLGAELPTALSISLLSFCASRQVDALSLAIDFGADPNAIPPGSDLPPLCIAASTPCDDRGSVRQIIELLLSRDANRYARDRLHRANAIMWATEEETINALLNSLEDDERSRYVNNRDEDGRTAFIWAAMRDADEAFLRLLIQNGADKSLTDYQGSSALHCAASEGRVISAEALLTKFEANVDATNLGGRTPLHLAVGKNQVGMVHLLLSCGASVEIQSSGGWSPLHFACHAFDENVRAENAEVARSLLNRSLAEHLILPTMTGKTPLHIAAGAGNIDVLSQLLIHISKEIKLFKQHDQVLLARLLCAASKQDDAGNIALFNQHIYRTDRLEIIQQLAPWNTNGMEKERLENDPSNRFRATIVDFLPGDRTIQVNEPSVFNLIYAGFEGSHEAVRITSPRKEYDYRWIHLPANKRSWCLDLFARCFIEMSEDEREDGGLHEESGRKESELFQEMARSLSFQRTGRTLHSSYMRTMCRSFCADDSDIADDARDQDRTAQTSFSIFEDDGGDGDEKLPYGHSPIDQGVIPGASGSSFHLYMPYIHYEYFADMQSMKKSLEHASTQSNGASDRDLLDGLHSEDRDYHPRRTLDQFLHRSMNTDERDQDQVVFRYQRESKPRGLGVHDDQCRIVMVDQLWLWVVNENLIITSFPHRLNKRPGDQHDVRERILNQVSAQGARAVPTVYDLASVIADTCSSAFGFSDVGQPRFIDMFEASIGNAMEDAVTSSKVLNDAAKKARLWLRSMSGERDSKDPQDPVRKLDGSQSAANSGGSQRKEKESGESKMKFVDSLLDLKLETDLLYSVNDIRDEIDMLSLVMRLQKRVLEDMNNVLTAIGQTRGSRLSAVINGRQRGRSGPDETSSLNTDTRRHSEVHATTSHTGRPDFTSRRTAKSSGRAAAIVRQSARSVQRTMTELSRMEKQAHRIYSTVTDSLDLKQRYANAIEARYVRAGGTTIMIFTTATVFFLPASFIVSMFGLNISGMPRQDGKLPSALVLSLVLGLGFFAGVAYLAIGLNINTIGHWWRAPNAKRESGQLPATAEARAVPSQADVKYNHPRNLKRRLQNGPSELEKGHQSSDS